MQHYQEKAPFNEAKTDSPERETENPPYAQVLLMEKVWDIPIWARPEQDKELPINFGVVIPGKIYRGGWPEDVSPLVNIGVSRLITLYSDRDQTGIANLPILREKTRQSGLTHLVFDIKSNEDLWLAAKQALATDEKTYIHCAAGANRTGLASLLIALLNNHTQEEHCNEKTLKDIIAKAIQHGYDFDQEKYRILLEQILNDSLTEGIISPSLFR